MANAPIDQRISELEQKLAQLKARKAQAAARARALEAKQSRQEDARQKIQLGGLVALAGLRSEDRGVVLGALLDAAERIHGENGAQASARWKAMGDAKLADQAAHNAKSAAAQSGAAA